jgi:hypothetical protein
MREAVLLVLCVLGLGLGCAKVKPTGMTESDLASPAEEDLAEEWPDLRATEPDLRGQELDFRGQDPDLRGPEPDLRGQDPDLRAPPPDLSTPPPDLSTPPDMTSPTYPRINEVAVDVGGVAVDEYIELVGGDKDILLFGWSLWYQPPGGGLGEQIFSFPVAILPARKYLLIAAVGSSYAGSADYTFAHTGSGKFGTIGGAVGLFQGLAKIDSMGWGSAVGTYVEGSAAPAPGMQSCSRLPDGADTNRNQIDFRVAAPTPRVVNR